MSARSTSALVLFCAAASWLAAPTADAQHEVVDWAMVARIRDEGFNRSKVMETLAQLTDVNGPRLTGSPGGRRASEWTRKQLEEWGLANARLEAWGPFGRGWSFERAAVHMTAPHTVPLIALPKAWTPGTSGAVRGKVVKAKLREQADLDAQRGKLAGTIVFLDDKRELKPPDQPLFRRHDEKSLGDLALFEVPRERRAADADFPADRESFLKQRRFQRTLRQFLVDEKALAIVEPSARDGAVVRVAGGGSREKDENPGVTALVMAAEHYNRIVRLLERKTEVELEVDVKAQFHDDELMAHNTLAEIPGGDKKAEIVMVGAHLDSWHSGTGATDNAAGSSVAMEAVRILKAIDAKPRRTIRIGLWTGEEQGLLGSRAYVRQTLGSRPEPTDADERALPSFLRKDSGPLTLKPEHGRFSAYFNLDNGTGKIRGVYMQENSAAAPIFEAWMKPLSDLGVTTLTHRNTGGTDHLAFDAVVLPGFQFIQEPADYNTRSHHTNVDVYDRMQRDDMMQAAVVMATFAYHAAMRDVLFPRKALPKDVVTAPVASPAPARR